MLELDNLNINNTNFKIGGQIADDVWVGKWLQLTPAALGASNTSSATYTINLVDIGYLPSDANIYDYELNISCWLWSNATNGNNGSLWLYNSDTTDNKGVRISLLYVRNRTANSKVSIGSCILPILKGNPYVTFYNSSNALASWGMQMTGYRRLGTNE